MKRIPMAVLAMLATSLPVFAGSKDCSGAELYSLGTTKYGRWEVRMQAGAKSGTVSSFFLYHNNSHEKGQSWRELDIEVLGKNPKGFQSNPITGTAAARITAEKFHDTEEDLSRGFHTYVMEWTPDSLVWELDGRRIRKIEGDSQVVDLRSKPMSWRMNLWASAWPDWTGPFDTASLPTCQFVNWIRFHEYTPGKGPGGSNWTEAWIDDFDSLNIGRWGQGTWGFEGNFAKFTPMNMGTKRGLAVLALTRLGQEGLDCGYPRGMYPEDAEGSTFPGAGKLGTLP
ncbi:MAG: family 16 glycosylhydrolase [Fibrobacteria bacterium]|nr:family 16 glycosylhydrolase [Fibrobacteria bacterium]